LLLRSRAAPALAASGGVGFARLSLAGRTRSIVAVRPPPERIATVDTTDTALLQQPLCGLDALIRVHLWKEDELFLAPLESFSWPALATSPSPEMMDA
jgi:hypothetical protein